MREYGLWVDNDSCLRLRHSDFLTPWSNCGSLGEFPQVVVEAMQVLVISESKSNQENSLSFDTLV